MRVAILRIRFPRILRRKYIERVVKRHMFDRKHLSVQRGLSVNIFYFARRRWNFTLATATDHTAAAVRGNNKILQHLMLRSRLSVDGIRSPNHWVNARRSKSLDEESGFVVSTDSLLIFRPTVRNGRAQRLSRPNFARRR